MHQPHAASFQPAIYSCADCEIEHNGDVNSLPPGWDRVKDPQSGRVTVRCPDCLERIERDYIALCRQSCADDVRRAQARSALYLADTPTLCMGRAAATYRGGLVA